MWHLCCALLLYLFLSDVSKGGDQNKGGHRGQEKAAAPAGWQFLQVHLELYVTILLFHVSWVAQHVC